MEMEEEALQQELPTEAPVEAEPMPPDTAIAERELMEEFGRRELAALNAAHGVGLESLDALRTAPEGERVMALFAQGVPLCDAYAAVHLGEITRREAAAARQAALNAMSSRAHLTKTGGLPAEEVAVPPEVYEQYRAMMPGWSDAKIRRSYRDYRKGEM